MKEAHCKIFNFAVGSSLLFGATPPNPSKLTEFSMSQVTYFSITININFNMGYNKAIDEFEERLTDELFLEGKILDKVSEIAEELKGSKV